MSDWKMVPIVPTTDMWAAAVPYQDSFGFAYREALAAAPKWEPSEAQIELGVQAYRAELTRIFDAADRLEAGDCYNAMRAALKAAFEEVEP